MKRAKLVLVLEILLLVILSVKASADDVIRLAVARFSSTTGNASNQDVALITDIFTDTFMHTKSIAVIERSRLEEVLREQRLGLSALANPATAAKAGRILGCQYVILGTVTDLTEKYSETKGESYTTKRVDAAATLYARVIDTTTSEVTYSASYTGRAQDEATSYKGDKYSETKTISSMKRPAIASAARILSVKIREAIADEAAQVIAVDGGTITLNRGNALGIHKGDLFLVYTDGKQLRDIDGTLLGSEVLNIAILEIKDVQERYSRAGVIKRRVFFRKIDTGSPAFIRVGDKMRYLTDEEADAVINQKSFINNRPKPKDADLLTAAKDDHTPKMEKVSTNPERCIPNYDLPEGEKKARLALHKKLIKAGRSRNTYARYVEMANSYSGDYLAAYQAGMTALALRMRGEALEWFNRALMINPDYKPAQEGRAKAK